MGKKKIYAVAVGHTTGLFDTWEDTKKATDGVPNADFKGFPTTAAAQAWLSTRLPDATIVVTATPAQPNPPTLTEEKTAKRERSPTPTPS